MHCVVQMNTGALVNWALVTVNSLSCSRQQFTMIWSFWSGVSTCCKKPSEGGNTASIKAVGMVNSNTWWFKECSVRIKRAEGVRRKYPPHHYTPFHQLDSPIHLRTWLSFLSSLPILLRFLSSIRFFSLPQMLFLTFFFWPNCFWVTVRDDQQFSKYLDWPVWH